MASQHPLQQPQQPPRPYQPQPQHQHQLQLQHQQHHPAQPYVPPQYPQAAPRGRRPFQRRGLFARDLRGLMYAFGDDPNPAPDTVNLLEEMVVDYITELCLQAQRSSHGRSRIKVDDLKFALRKDSKKLARVEELLYMQQDIKRARAQFEPGVGEPAAGAGSGS